jgi:U3 small nucleolar RNA-associated protein 11
MASFRNAEQRREHRERAQPAARQKLGLLEKHKDYVLRAKDYHRKERRLQAMKERITLHNPDEFYFKMNSAKLVHGKHVEKRPYRLPKTIMERMAGQDQQYLQMRAHMDAQKAEKLAASLHFVDAPRRNKHVLFEPEPEEDGLLEAAAVTSKKARSAVAAIEPDASSSDGASAADESADLAPAPAHQEGHAAASHPLPTEVERARALAYKELALRLQRKKKLTTMVADIEQRRNLLGKGRRFKEKGPNGTTVYRWQAQRKK